MKKSLKLFILLILMLIILTGCVDINYEVTINSDGTANITYVYGFEKEYLEEMEVTAEEMTQEIKKDAETSKYTVETYSDDKIEGIKATKTVTDFSQISLEEAFGAEYVSDSEENKIKLEKKGLKTVYSQKADIDLTSMDETMSSIIKMKYAINLPTKSESNNANEVSEDGKTLIWNLKAGEVNKIEFKATELGTIAKIIIILIILVSVGIIIAIVIITVRKIKNRKNNIIETENVTVQENSNDLKNEE